ncbi:helix-turn-helix domain-containing protein [Thermoflexibacter ruber]|uniref:HTH domain-containing protein n=1 Tax=Thermoflexibacter ruber TaxID=1003 RepID=A0A1I2KDL0_9BACT|nr:helix-turn-helix domain-containing protein [Thermoflexibacter ruber]SFF63297.1 HTH domain-containing protein [Thermoflexibacter ruber]
MNISKLTVLVFLHHLISKKATGDVNSLAKQLGVSRRTVFNYIDELKSIGAPIAYCHTARSYVYTDFWEASLLTFLWTNRHQ